MCNVSTHSRSQLLSSFWGGWGSISKIFEGTSLTLSNIKNTLRWDCKLMADWYCESENLTYTSDISNFFTMRRKKYFWEIFPLWTRFVSVHALSILPDPLAGWHAWLEQPPFVSGLWKKLNVKVSNVVLFCRQGHSRECRVYGRTPTLASYIVKLYSQAPKWQIEDR